MHADLDDTLLRGIATSAGRRPRRLARCPMHAAAVSGQVPECVRHRAWSSREAPAGRAVAAPESGAAGLGEPAHPVAEPVGAVGNVDAGGDAAIVPLM